MLTASLAEASDGRQHVHPLGVAPVSRLLHACIYVITGETEAATNRNAENSATANGISSS